MCCDSLALASTFSFITPSHSLFLLAGREENAPRLRQLAPILVVASLRKEFRLSLIFQTDPRLTATSHRFDQRTFFLSSMSNPWSTNWDAESHDSEDADEGEVVADRKHWWPTSLGSASWAPEDSVKGLIASRLVYHLPDQESNSSLTPKLEDVSLNQDHLACRLAEAAVASYEANVGFSYAVCPPIDHDESRVVFSLEPTSDAKERARRVVRLAALKRLIQMLQEERGDAVERTPSLDNEDSLSSSLTDSAYSENSGDFFAMPATPNSKASYANVLLKNVSPSSSLSDESPIATPSKQLSPFATSFVPGSAEASGFSSFTFPTLNPPTNSTTRLTTVKIKKDDQGFFTSDVQVDEDTEPKSPLPSFLQQPSPRRRTRMSKTREMVDRLRADNLTAKCISLSPSPDVHCDLRPSIQPRLTVSEDGGDRDRESNLSTPSQDDEDEEWMCVSSKAPEPTASTSKAKRARDMLLALTRRMTTESTSSEASSKDDTAAHAKRPSSSHYSAPNSDGWIEGLPTCESPKPTPQRSASTKPLTKPPPPPKKKQHHSSKSSSTTSSSVPSLLPSPTHASFPTGPSPYMPMMSPPPAQFGFSIPPSPPVAVPMPFFFGPAAPVGPPPPGYPHAMHPHPHALPQVVPYSPPAVAYMPQSPFVPVPIHPGYSAVVAGVGPKMGGMYQSPGVWNQGQKRQAWPGYGKV